MFPGRQIKASSRGNDTNMSQTVNTNVCANCYHDKTVHKDGVCMGDLSCQCFNFIENELYNFAMEVEKEKLARKSIYKRCKYILEKIPQTRNAGERSFYRIFIEIWFGFKIRKGTPMVMDDTWWKRLPNQDSISREKRRVKKDHPELGTFDPNVLEHQKIIYQACLELCSHG